MIYKTAVATFLVFLLGMAHHIHAQPTRTHEKLQQLFDRYYNDRMRLFPTEATSGGDHRYDDQLPCDGGAPHIAATVSFYKKYLAALNNIDRRTLTTADRISCDILQYSLNTALEAVPLHLEYLPMTQFVSTPLEMAQLGSGGSAQPFHTLKDYENWRLRMQAFGAWADTAISNFNKGIRAGVVLPKVLVQKTIPQLEELAVADSSRNVFYQPLSRFPASFTAAEKQMITHRYHQVITKDLLPAYQRLAVYLKNTYLAAAQEQAGLSALPGGDKIYAYYVRLYTSSPDITPEQVYQTGLKEVARITREMEAIKTATGFSGTLAGFFHFLRTDARFMPFKTPEEVLAAYRQINDKVQPHIAALFGHTPATPFEIRRVPAYQEAAQGGPFYVKGNLQENVPAIFYVPVPDATKINVTFQGMEATFIHEAIPGHHFQISSQQENENIPAFRRQPSFYAYFEGWALYCESLGAQLGCYTDPYQKMGALNMEIHRAIRLVVDVAIHTGKMTREEAVVYMTQHESISEAVANAEVERYMAMPGQALSYKTGELHIRALRNRLAGMLGPQFDLKAFHDALLAYGDMPLSVLDSYMEDWARSVKQDNPPVK